ncbi:MAG TPA: amidohydrolase family protein [Chloroflexota bacterium]|nr:amidohydrolase family protein [Chloroflexota bacterium]
MAPERVIDADGHIIESETEIFAYLPPPYRGQDQLFSYPFFPTLDGWHRAARRVTDGKGFVTERPDAGAWIEYLDDANIAATVLFPTAGLAFGLISDPEWAAALARGYNDWLSDRFMRADPKRIKGMALIPVQDPPEAARELRRVVRDLGMVGGILPAVGLQRAFGDRQFWPIYEAAQELNVILAVHGAPNHNLGLDRLQRLIEVRALTHPFSQMIQLTSMIFSGVFDAFPRLRVAYCEAGCGWVPFMAERLDMEFHNRTAQAPDLKCLPSEHMAGGRIFFHTELDEGGLAAAVNKLGRSDVFFSASDYPHEKKEEYPEKIADFLARRDLPTGAQRTVLWDVPIRMYALDQAAL